VQRGEDEEKKKKIITEERRLEKKVNKKRVQEQKNPAKGVTTWCDLGERNVSAADNLKTNEEIRRKGG